MEFANINGNDGGGMVCTLDFQLLEIKRDDSRDLDNFTKEVCYCMIISQVDIHVLLESVCQVFTQCVLWGFS